MRAHQRTLVDWLRDIESNAARIAELTDDLTFEHFTSDEAAMDIVVARLQNMGEAARYVVLFFPAYAALAPLPLGEMRMMRNRLTHGYFDISFGIVWQAAKRHVPDVLARVRELIAAEQKR